MSVPIIRLFLAIVVLFALLVAWTSRWTIFQADDLRANTLDKRPLFAALRVKRGAITTEGGEVLARSVRTRNGDYERDYPTDSLFGHPVGYAKLLTGELSGLERSRNDELSGTTSELNSVLDQLQGKRRAGNTVVTTLDPQAQQVATDALDGQKGAVFAFDPRDGAVKVMVSSPGYDPNMVNGEGGLSELNKDAANAPLLDRVTQGAYPPGSTFKVVTAAAALDSGKFTPDSTFDGRSGRVVSGVPLRNDGGQDFDNPSLTTSLTYSVNTAFAQMGEQLGKRTMADYMDRFGFYRLPPLDYPDEQMIKSGERRNGRLVPVTSPSVDVGRMAIGQDRLLVTPIQMAMVAGAVANGGKLMEPHLTDKVVDPDGRTVKTIEPKQFSQPISEQTASELTQMMGRVVEEGTGSEVQLPGIDVAGKTGTAEIDVANDIAQPWFIAFAPASDPQIAIAVTVERTVGGFGGTVAAPIARDVLASLLQR
ncbi:penicillin-binding protein 2 [Conexibacter sp. JD483]|uniref:peptidoglycan D,D-transpeptidase FtsI family protein n=1 Tax=unclassified Conexibacter TaxID=2627773 RepID=UPI002728D244|nr:MULTISPECIES: penicillin-binding protein 2 [unclassified Conexibacter]MDO8184462.1 penicillin-binding protein 2 [Conexibacter sp. CPCC 205706]MDO8197768.1 penicillin-binding protein 2 [Conexibacter sp. CPCC 205762]MDR9368096.1 penicillin-binding protein 2 [Conexibacter sp. JD483]